jgi:hypothetical protein
MWQGRLAGRAGQNNRVSRIDACDSARRSQARPGVRRGMNVGRAEAKKVLGQGQRLSEDQKRIMFGDAGHSKL